ncbi:MAG TPA: prepilin-type N-terminal cleavage/methylation domain-containing protein [Opitutaceae bacterium]|nr:prepilin-type N-terminal cleavage/methylation domain-containing protein [Opitutaceae bacterium]
MRPDRRPTASGRHRSRCSPERGRAGAREASATPGFTLLEVLVALAIFALAAVVLGATYVNALNAYEAATRRNGYSEDLRFARMAVLTEPDRNKVEEGGELDLGGGKRARWQADVASTNTVDLFSVTWTCAITNPARPEPFRTSQTFLLLRPTWSDPVERATLLEQTRERILQIQGTAP